MIINKYSNSVIRNTNKLLKKMFGYKNVKDALDDQKLILDYLQYLTNKDIDTITIDDVKQYPNGSYFYVKYRTLKKITDLYLQVIELKYFNGKEWGNYSK